MAKVSGPLMSLSASGSIADTITFSIWKGRPYVRELVIPSNPQTAGQAAVRSILGAIAKSAKAVLTSFKDGAGFGSAFFQTARAAAPSGITWANFMGKEAYASDSAMRAAWAALSGTEQGYFTTAAATVSLVDYDPSYPDGTSTPAGELLFLLAYFAVNSLEYAGFVDLDAPTSLEVDDFATYVGTSNP